MSAIYSRRPVHRWQPSINIGERERADRAVRRRYREGLMRIVRCPTRGEARHAVSALQRH